MESIAVHSADDPRIADYVALSDPELRRGIERAHGFFVAEGPLVIRKLLTTNHQVRSVLVIPRQRAALADVLDQLDAPVYVVEPAVMEQTVGFDLHRGAVAAVERYPMPAIERVLEGASRIAILERVNDHENLGALFRNAAAFGFDALLLCPQCSDPLYRRTVRVSIGHVLTVPWTRAEPWPAALDLVGELGFTLLALTPAADARRIETITAPSSTAPSSTGTSGAGRIAILVGAEGPGLSDAALARSAIRVRIPMAPGVDSLNVGVAAAVAFAHFARAERLE
jgi:tRNA G18 (ribose-2'-O)-methylase SpoU